MCRSYEKIISGKSEIRKRKNLKGFITPSVPFAERQNISMKVQDSSNSIFCDCNNNLSFKNKIKSSIKYLVWPKYTKEKLSVMMRIAMRLAESNMHFFGEIIEFRILKKYNCHISCNSKIGPGVFFPHPMGIVIGRDAQIGENVEIYQNVTIGQKNGLYPHIYNNVTIFSGACIVGGVKIGNNAVVGAASVVLHDVPDNAIVAGNPARIIGYKMP